MIYYVLAVITGFIVVFNLVINSSLSKKTDIFLSTLSNYFIGSVTTLIVVLVLKEKADILPFKEVNISFIYYLGGFFGVAVVTIYNGIVHKIPVIYSTILTFIGQLLMGLILDLILGNTFSIGKILGLILISIGFLYNVNIDRKLKGAQY